MRSARPNPVRRSGEFQPRGTALYFLILLGLLLFSVGPRAASAAAGNASWATDSDPSPVDPEGYRQVLRAALADLDGGGQVAAGQTAARLRSTGPVALPGGTLVWPDLDDTLASLEATPPDVAAARARLRALLAELDRAQTQPGPDVGRDPRQQLENVLSRREFRPDPEPDALNRWYQQLLDAVLGWLGRLLGPVWDWLSQCWGQVWGEGIKTEVWQTAATAAGLALVIGLIVWVVRSLRRAVGPAPSRVAAGKMARREDAEGARAEALRLAQGGDFRGAMRALYLAVLLRLDELGKLRFDRSLTNREVLVRATGGGESTLAERLAPLVERFDRFWYGAAACSADDYSDFARLAGAVWDD